MSHHCALPSLTLWLGAQAPAPGTAVDLPGAGATRRPRRDSCAAPSMLTLCVPAASIVVRTARSLSGVYLLPPLRYFPLHTSTR